MKKGKWFIASLSVTAWKWKNFSFWKSLLGLRWGDIFYTTIIRSAHSTLIISTKVNISPDSAKYHTFQVAAFK